MQSATRRQLVGMSCLVAVAAVATLLFSPSTVVTELEHLATHPLQFAIVLTAVYLVRPFLLWPVSALGLVLGFLYDPLVALPVALVGATLSGLPPFFIARYVDTEAGILGFIGTSGRTLVDNIGETRGVIAARFSPIPGDPISYAAGLSEVSLGAFLLGTIVGELPWALVTVYAGSSMRRLSVSGFSVSPAAVVAISGLALIVLSGPVYSLLRGGPAPE